MKRYREQGLVGYMNQEQKKAPRESPFGASMDQILAAEKRRRR